MLVGSFNQEKALVGAFSVIVKTDGSFAALIQTLPAVIAPGPAPPLRPVMVMIVIMVVQKSLSPLAKPRGNSKLDYLNIWRIKVQI